MNPFGGGSLFLFGALGCALLWGCGSSSVNPAETAEAAEARAAPEPLPGGDPAGERMLALLEAQARNPFPKPDDPENIGNYAWGKLSQGLSLLLTGGDAAVANQRIREGLSVLSGDAGGLAEAEHFHWQGNLLFRIYALFSSHATYRPGLLEPEVASEIARLFAVYLEEHSWEEDPATLDPWLIWGSENHHLMKASTLWSAAAVLEADPVYRDKPIAGHPPAVWSRDWNTYFIRLLTERFGTGLWIEYASPGYLKYSLQALYNFHDFAANDALRAAATACLDLHWAQWAIEQVNGMRGGPKIRLYSGRDDRSAAWDGSNLMGALYFGVGLVNTGQHPAYLCQISSAYRPPSAIAPLVTDPGLRVAPETIVSRTVGRAAFGPEGEPQGEPQAIVDGGPWYRFDPDLPSLLRLTRRAPRFALGGFYLAVDPFEHWTNVASQNQWNGLVQAGRVDGLITLRVEGEGSDRSTYNGQRAVLHGGTLMVQGLPRTTVGRYIWPLTVRIGSETAVETAGAWRFLQTEDLFVAFRPATGRFFEREAGVFTVRKRNDPVVFQVVDAAEFGGSFEEFKNRVQSQAVTVEDGVVFFESAFGGARLGMDIACEALPTIDGRVIDLAAAPAWESRFLYQAWEAREATLDVPGQAPLVLSPERERRKTPATAVWARAGGGAQ